MPVKSSVRKSVCVKRVSVRSTQALIRRLLKTPTSSELGVFYVYALTLRQGVAWPKGAPYKGFGRFVSGYYLVIKGVFFTIWRIFARLEFLLKGLIRTGLKLMGDD